MGEYHQGQPHSDDQLTHDPEKHVLDVIGDGNQFPAGACARAGQRPDPSAKPASAGEARLDKIMRRKKQVRDE
jgi:hypothetical protein